MQIYNTFWGVKMKKIIITDLDDTLYDWLGFFIPSFYEMVDEIVNITIIGYTESAQENGFYRLKKLGISQYFKRIYTSTSEYESNIPLDEKIITVKTKKPDKDVLINICNQENCSISDAAYIGDSLTKDVYMAKLANMTSIWANYPKEKNNYYDLLVDITNWTEDDFIREKELKKKYISFGIKPDYTISKFSQLLPIILQEI